MLLIAASDPNFTKACREMLSASYELYEPDIHDRHALETCIKKCAIQILIVDLAILGQQGITEIQHLKEWCPELHIIVMTNHFDEREQVNAIIFGAQAYCDIQKELSFLPKIIKTVLANELWVDRKFTTRLLAEIEDITALRKKETRALDAGIAKMTPREVEIAEWIGKGASNRKIAEILNITERTVKAHLGVIFRKLGVHDRLQLALYMNRHHQIPAIWHTKNNRPS